MPQNRTPKLLLLLTSIVMPGAPTLLAQSSAESGRVQLARAEQQPLGDLGNGYYRNPIIAGDYADNSVVRVGPEYFLVHSGGQPRGMLVWHSRDLVSWEPYSIVTERHYLGSRSLLCGWPLLSIFAHDAPGYRHGLGDDCQVNEGTMESTNRSRSARL